MFNWALIAKQVWRIVQRPSSRPSRIFKAKYFANVSFWEASLGSSPSFVWRGIWQARQVLELGTRWCIGSGVSVNIRKDRWVTGLSGFKISSPCSDVSEIAIVDTLFSSVARMWNESMIKRLFSQVEADAILSIVLGS